MFPSAEDSCVELRLVDSEDGLSEWTYRVWLWNSSKLKELRSSI
jgi:hypothetical protein